MVDNYNDQDLYAGAISDEKPAVEQEQQPRQEEAKAPPADEGRSRDEQGRFAPAPKVEKPAEPVKTEAQPPVADPDHAAQVPSWRLREIRDDRDAMARRAQEAEERARRYEAQLRQAAARAEPPKPPPDMLADPDAWQQHIASQLQTETSRLRFEISEDAARDKFGDEKVNSALKWLEGNLDPATRQRITSARNPYREMVTLYDERQTLSQIGGDLGAYKTRLLDEALNDPAFMEKVGAKLREQQGTPSTNGSRPVVNLPPSLSRAAGSRVPQDGAGDMSDASLYQHATAPGPRR